MADDKRIVIIGLSAVAAYMLYKRSTLATSSATTGKLPGPLGAIQGAIQGAVSRLPLTGTNVATQNGTATRSQPVGTPAGGGSTLGTIAGLATAGAGIAAAISRLASLGSGQSNKPGQTPNNSGKPNTPNTASTSSSRQTQGQTQAATGIPCTWLDFDGNCTTDATQAVWDVNGNPLGGGINPNAPNGFDASGSPILETGPQQPQGPVQPAADCPYLDANGNCTSDASVAVYNPDGTPLPGASPQDACPYLDANGACTTDPSAAVYDANGNPLDEFTAPEVAATPLPSTDLSSVGDASAPF